MQSPRLPGAVGNDGRLDRDPAVDAGAPAPVWLHPHRGVGACYGALAVVVLAIVVLALVTYLSSGRFLMAVATTVGGLGVTAFLAVLALALLVPGLEVRPTGLTGRLAAGRQINVGWDEVSVDMPENAPPGWLRLDVAGHCVEVDVRSWAGFREFVLLVASIPDAARRLTPEARGEVARLLGLGNA